VRHQPADHGADRSGGGHRQYDRAEIDKIAHFGLTAEVAGSPKHPETLHYTGDGAFLASGEVIDRRKLFRPGMF